MILIFNCTVSHVYGDGGVAAVLHGDGGFDACAFGLWCW